MYVPVCFRWLYNVECEIKVLKRYVRNKFQPESRIVENYAMEVLLDFFHKLFIRCNTYRKSSRTTLSNLHNGRGTHGIKDIRISR